MHVITDTSSLQASHCHDLHHSPACLLLHAMAAGSLPYHSHSQQEESLQVLSGLMGYSLDGRLANASAGEVVLVPAGEAGCLVCYQQACCRGARSAEQVVGNRASSSCKQQCGDSLL
jgi:hypothetical protein